MNNIIILDTEIAQAKKIILEDSEGDLLFNKILVIDASGLYDSLRKTRDGYVFFGPIAEYVTNFYNIYYYFLERHYNKRLRGKYRKRFV